MSSNGNTLAGKRRPDRAALTIAAFLLALAALIFWDIAHLKAIANYSQVGPATVPNIIAGCLVILGLWTAAEAWRGDFPEREPQKLAPIAWIVGGLLAQMLLLKLAGFSIATGVMFAATAAAFGKRKLWITLPVGIVLCFAVYSIFAKLLKLSLPAGFLEHLFF